MSEKHIVSTLAAQHRYHADIGCGVQIKAINTLRYVSPATPPSDLDVQLGFAPPSHHGTGNEEELVVSGGDVVGVRYRLDVVGLDETIYACIDSTATVADHGDNLLRLLWPQILPYLDDLAAAEILTPAQVRWLTNTHCPPEDAVPPWRRNITLPPTPLTGHAETDVASIMDRLTDDHAADCVIRASLGWIIYDPEQGKWYIWRDNHWAPSISGAEVRQVALRVLDAQRNEKNNVLHRITLHADAEKSAIAAVRRLQTAYTKMLQRWGTIAGINSICNIASSDPRLRISIRGSSDPHLIAYRNGILDTRTGRTIPPCDYDSLRDRYCTAYIDCDYVDRDSDIWVQHLRTCMTDNTTQGLSDDVVDRRTAETVAYILRLLGYALIAGNPEQIMVWLWGTGANGKSATLEIVKQILGAQSYDISCSELYVTDSDVPRSGLARGIGRRVVMMSEASTGTGRKAPVFSSAIIKVLTGEKTTSEFREMRKAAVQNNPIYCLPVATTNDMPLIDTVDDAYMRRMVCIPFSHVFTHTSRDPAIVEKLLGDKDAIWSMMVRALGDYLRHGLCATPEYCKMQLETMIAGEAVKAFLDAATAPESVPDSAGVKGTVMQDYYLQWCMTEGYDVPTRRKNIVGPSGIPDTCIVLARAEVSRLYLAARQRYGSYHAHDGEHFRLRLA